MDRQRSLRAIVALNEMISDRLRVIGIDPALAETLRRGEEAVAELAAIPDTLDLKTADETILRSGYTNADDGRAKSGRKLGRWQNNIVGGRALSRSRECEATVILRLPLRGAWGGSVGVGRPRPALARRGCC
jgi:hypothetical protein